MTDTHTWTSATDLVRSDGERITSGEAFSPTDFERRCWHDRIEPIGGDGTCTAIKSDGDVCGRDLPCQYHDESDDAEPVAEFAE